MMLNTKATVQPRRSAKQAHSTYCPALGLEEIFQSFMCMDISWGACQNADSDSLVLGRQVLCT
jgi:hypothetical protein